MTPKMADLTGDRGSGPTPSWLNTAMFVTSPDVKDPVAVRYAWKNAPDANLFNGAGLPVVPFRTDNW